MCGLVATKRLGKGVSSVFGKGETGKEAPKRLPTPRRPERAGLGVGRSSQGLAI